MKYIVLMSILVLSFNLFAQLSMPAKYAQYVKEMCEDYKLKPLVALAEKSEFSETSSGYGDVGCTTYRARGSVKLRISHCTSGDRDEYVVESADRYVRVFAGNCTANEEK